MPGMGPSGSGDPERRLPLKKSIAIDLKSDRGKEVLKKLILSADVLLENFAPGTIERLGRTETMNKPNEVAAEFMKKNLRQSFSEFIVDTSFNNLPKEVVDQTKRCVLDFLGVALAGSRVGLAPIITDIVCNNRGKQEATIIGDGRKIPALDAALVNSVKAHTLDMDDCQRYASGHPGIVAIPASLALAESENVTGKEFIEAIVVGYELFIRIAAAINPSHFRKGFHTTGTVGSFAAAAAASKILGLNKKQVENALSIAGLQGAGLLEVTNSGQMMKPLHSGRAAQAGVLAALLAREGAEGPDLIFEGEKGFFRAFTDLKEPVNITRGLNTNFEIMSTAFKLYATCRVSHPSVDAALEICKKEHLSDKDIMEIDIETFPYAIKLCGAIVHPKTSLAAKFSIPYTIAMAISLGDLFVDKFTEANIHNEVIKELASKVKVSVSEKWDREYPEKKGTTVTIKTNSGISYTLSTSLPKGEPENPASLEDLIQKFQSNSMTMLSEHKSNKLKEDIFNLEKLEVRDVMQLFF